DWPAAPAKSVVASRAFVGDHHNQRRISAAMGALRQQPYRHRPRLARLLTQPLDGKNVIAHPVARRIAQALRDKVLTPKETARHCSSLGGFAQHDNAGYIRSAPAARSARQRGSPSTGTPLSPTSPSAP